LLREINTRFDVPHSRFNDISREQLERAGLTVLVDSREGGVHMAVSEDQFRLVYLQGHPEYDTNSLLKEYKREVLRYLNGELHQPPPIPDHYFSPEARHTAERFVQDARQALWEDRPLPDYLEQEIEPGLENTWGDTAKAIVANWLGLVYQLTNLDRRKQYMEGVDPDNPLKFANPEDCR
jgi:homoserine O-succinyltransferase